MYDFIKDATLLASFVDLIKQQPGIGITTPVSISAR